jgi:hypothetical protein
MKPVKVFGDYVVCFEAEEEMVSLRRHFIQECGWTEAQYRKIRDFAWFSAKVSLWRHGKELAVEYLGACCYKTEDEFWTAYEGDYFADMVRECAQETKDLALLAVVEPWHAAFREKAA